MEFLRDLDIALLVTGKERIFCYIDISTLESRLKQLQSGSSISPITIHPIEKVKSCHLFSVAKVCALCYCNHAQKSYEVIGCCRCVLRALCYCDMWLFCFANNILKGFFASWNFSYFYFIKKILFLSILANSILFLQGLTLIYIYS